MNNLRCFKFRSQLAFPFISSILKPNFHLSFCESQWSCKSCSFRWTQISDRSGLNQFFFILLKVIELTFSDQKLIRVEKPEHDWKLFSSSSFVCFVENLERRCRYLFLLYFHLHHLLQWFHAHHQNRCHLLNAFDLLKVTWKALMEVASVKVKDSLDLLLMTLKGFTIHKSISHNILIQYGKLHFNFFWGEEKTEKRQFTKNKLSSLMTTDRTLCQITFNRFACKQFLSSAFLCDFEALEIAECFLFFAECCQYTIW